VLSKVRTERSELTSIAIYFFARSIASFSAI
jgi:hypothetical protein